MNKCLAVVVVAKLYTVRKPKIFPQTFLHGKLTDPGLSWKVV